jgi:hypothetical protein
MKLVNFPGKGVLEISFGMEDWSFLSQRLQQRLNVKHVGLVKNVSDQSWRN